jgi:MFS family permease
MAVLANTFDESNRREQMEELSAETERRVAARAALAIAPGVLLAGVAGGIAFPILPLVGLRTGMSLSLMGVILAANRFGRIISAPLVGAWADRFGGRTLLLGGLVTQMVVMSLYVLGVTSKQTAFYFLLGRLLHGPGSACVFVAAQAMALQAGGRSNAGLAGGTVRAAMSVGLPFGLLAGGVLSSRFGDAGAFEASLAALVLATIVASIFLPKQLVDAVAVKGRVSVREALRAVIDRRVGALGVLNFAAAFSALGVVLTTLILVIDSRGVTFGSLDSKQSGSLLMGWLVVVTGVGTLAASRLIRRDRTQAWIAAIGTALLSVSMWLLGSAVGLMPLLFSLTLLGVGAGALSSALLALLGAFVGIEQRGAGVGWLQLCGDIGGMLGPIVGSKLLGYSPGWAYNTTACVLLICLPVAAWLVAQTPKESASSSSATPRGSGK